MLDDRTTVSHLAYMMCSHDSCFQNNVKSTEKFSKVEIPFQNNVSNRVKSLKTRASISVADDRHIIYDISLKKEYMYQWNRCIVLEIDRLIPNAKIMFGCTRLIVSQLIFSPSPSKQ